MADADTTVAELKCAMARFVAERRWEQYHTPKNLAVSLVLEAAELLEHFQWRTDEEANRYVQQPEALQEIADELADVLSYVLSMANALNIDLSTAFENKLRKNEARYPADQWRGRAH